MPIEADVNDSMKIHVWIFTIVATVNIFKLHSLLSVYISLVGVENFDWLLLTHALNAHISYNQKWRQILTTLI